MTFRGVPPCTPALLRMPHTVPLLLFSLILQLPGCGAVLLCRQIPEPERAECVTLYQPVAQTVSSELQTTLAHDPTMGPLIVRLAWHSSGTFNAALSPPGGTEGGCIRMPPESTDGANARLLRSVQEIYRLVLLHPFVTFADMVQLAAVVVHELAGSGELLFSPGRTDAHIRDTPQRCSANGRLPAKHLSDDWPHPQSQEYVLQKYALYLHALDTTVSPAGLWDDAYVEEAVALMGGHTLGGMHLEVSGNLGNFTTSPYVFNNEYYKNMVDMAWGPADAVGKWVNESHPMDLQYTQRGVTLLATDIGMALHPQMSAWVVKFAENNTLFLESYRRAWTQLVENGVPFGGLPPTGPSTQPTPPPSDTACDAASNSAYTCGLRVGSAGEVMWTTEDTRIRIAATAEEGVWLGISFPTEKGAMAPAPFAAIASAEGTGFYSISGKSRAGITPLAAAEAAARGLHSLTHVAANGRQTLSLVAERNGTMPFDPQEAFVNIARGSGLPLTLHTAKGSASVNFITGAGGEAEDSLKAWRSLHGYLMIIACVFLMPIGVLSKRYGKRVFHISDSSKWPFGPAFAVHLICMVSAFTLILISIGIAFVKLYREGDIEASGSHRSLGKLTLGLCTGVMSMGTVARATPATSRPFRILHGLAGGLTLCVMILQSLLGLERLEAYYPDLRTHERMVAVGLSAFIVLLPCLEWQRRSGRPAVPAPPAGAAADPDGGSNVNGMDQTVSCLLTHEEVARHNTPEDPWLIIEGKVYNVAGWPAEHPGGPDVILSMAGKDATDRFHLVNHSVAALRRMRQYLVGAVQSTETTQVVDLISRIAECLVALDTEEAAFLLKNPPPGIARSVILEFQCLLETLEVFRPYIPLSVLESLGISGGFEDTYPMARAGVSVSSPAVDPVAQRFELEKPTRCYLAFTDIQASTRLWEATQRGMQHGLSLHNEVVRSAITDCGGYEVKTIGDAFMVAFLSPLDAVRFGITVQEQLLTAAWSPLLLVQKLCEPKKDSFGNLIWNGLRVRIGVHGGDVDPQVNPLTHRVDFFGHTVNTAARIEGVAHGGCLCVSDDVVAELRSGDSNILTHLQMTNMGTVALKGVKAPPKLWMCLPLSLGTRKQDIARRNEATIMDSLGMSLCRANTNLASATGTCVCVMFNLRTVTGEEHPGRAANALVSGVHISAQRTDGCFQGLCGSMIMVTFNVGTPCLQHQQQAVRFGMSFERPTQGANAAGGASPEESLASSCISGMTGVHMGRIRQEVLPSAYVGAVTGTILSGTVGGKTQKAILVAGTAVDASMRLAASALEFKAPYLLAAMPGFQGSNCEPAIAPHIRVADVWVLENCGSLLPIYEVHIPLLSRVSGLWGFGPPLESPRESAWGTPSVALGEILQSISECGEELLPGKELPIKSAQRDRLVASRDLYIKDLKAHLCSSCQKETVFFCTGCGAICDTCSVPPKCKLHVPSALPVGTPGVTEHMQGLLKTLISGNLPFPIITFDTGYEVGEDSWLSGCTNYPDLAKNKADSRCRSSIQRAGNPLSAAGSTRSFLKKGSIMR